MSVQSFSRRSAIAAALGALGIISAAAVGLAPLAAALEMKTYDARVRLTAGASRARSDIVLVNIDEESIRQLDGVVGRWPWPRLVHAQLVEFLARGPARTVAYDVLFSERDRTSFELQGETWTGAESDRALVEAVERAGNVILAADATREEAIGRPAGAAVDRAAMQRVIPVFQNLTGALEERPVITLPFTDLATAARAIGHSFLALDSDGPARRSVPFIRVAGQPIPSLAAAAALVAGGTNSAGLSADRGGVNFGKVRMPVILSRAWTLDGTSRPTMRSLIRFVGGPLNGNNHPYQEFSFYRLFYSEQQILAGQRPLVEPNAFRDKIVVVGATAAGLHDTFTVPFKGQMPGSAIHATVVDDILSGRFMAPAPRAAGWLMAALAALLVGGACAFLGAWWTIGVAGVVLAGIVLLDVALFARGTWVPVVQPSFAVVATAFSGVAYQYLVEGREKRRMKRVFSRLVAPDVYRHLLADPSSARLGGECRDMTVLFSDLRGFTTMSEGRTPEDVVRQLNEYFTRMVEVVFAHRGTVDKFVGDMVMALFGAPLDDDDSADNAVRTALEMERALEEMNGRWAREGRPTLALGVGINSGEMVAGNIGSEQIMSYTVIGDAVNLASRLESLNKQFGTSIIISDATRRRLKGHYQIRSLGNVTVKGKSQAVEVYAVERGDMS